MKEKKEKRANGEGSWGYNDAKNLYVYRVTLNGTRKAFYGKTKQECRKKCKSFQEEQKNAGKIITKRTTVREYSRHYMDYKKNKLKQTTYVSLLVCLDLLDKSDCDLKNRQLTGVTKDIIIKFFDSFANTKSLSSMKSLRFFLHDMFKLAVQENYLNTNPMEDITLDKNKYFPKKERRIFKEEEIEIFTEFALKEKKSSDLLLLLILNTGMRAGEAIALQWGDYRDGGLYITRQGIELTRKEALEMKPTEVNSHRIGNILIKGPKSETSKRFIPLNNQAKAILQYTKTHYAREGDDFIFRTAKGKLFNSKIIRQRLRTICKNANLPMLTTHELRHTFATVLLDKNANIKIISELLGHSSTNVTYESYIHTSNQQKIDTVNILGEINGNHIINDSSD